MRHVSQHPRGGPSARWPDRSWVHVGITILSQHQAFRTPSVLAATRPAVTLSTAGGRARRPLRTSSAIWDQRVPLAILLATTDQALNSTISSPPSPRRAATTRSLPSSVRDNRAEPGTCTSELINGRHSRSRNTAPATTGIFGAYRPTLHLSVRQHIQDHQPAFYRCPPAGGGVVAGQWVVGVAS